MQQSILFTIQNFSGITSGTDLTGDYDISFQSELGKEIEPEQLDPSNYANVDAAPTNHECNYVSKPIVINILLILFPRVQLF